MFKIKIIQIQVITSTGKTKLIFLNRVIKINLELIVVFIARDEKMIYYTCARRSTDL